MSSDPLAVAADVLAGVLVVVGALLMLVSAIAMHRQRDAFARINVLSPATGLGLPLIVAATFLHSWSATGFSWVGLLKTVVTMTALLVVSSVASNVIARAAYLSGAPVHPDTEPQELAHAPEGARDDRPTG